MSVTPRRSPRVSLPPRTRDFNPLESHSRGGGCLPWLMVIGAGLITGTLIAFAMLYFASAPLPFLSQANSATASPTLEVPRTNTATSATVAAALSPPTASPTFTPKPSATQTPTPADTASPTFIPAPSERTATPIPTVPTNIPTVLAQPTVTATLTGGDPLVQQIRVESNPIPQLFATRRILTFVVTFQNPNVADYPLNWVADLYPAENLNAVSPFGESPLTHTQIPPGISQQRSGDYNYLSGGEKHCYIVRVYQVSDASPHALMNGTGQNLPYCVGIP